MTQRLRIGLTGGIASGKSTVAQRFKELGVPVIDADEAARAVVAPGTPGLAQVVATFGPRVISPDGTLDRRALRNQIFADPVLRRQLEAILHPLIRAKMDQDAAAAVGPYLVLAIPLLVEGGKSDRVDRILVVDVDEAVQRSRVVSRDGTTPEQAQAILAAQISREKRVAAADDLITNDGSVAELRQQVDDLHARYRLLAQSNRVSQAD